MTSHQTACRRFSLHFPGGGQAGKKSQGSLRSSSVSSMVIQSCRAGGSNGEGGHRLGQGTLGSPGSTWTQAKGYHLFRSSSSTSARQMWLSINSYRFFRAWFTCHHLWEVFPEFPRQSLPTFLTPRANPSLLPLRVQHKMSRSHLCCDLCVSLARS